MPKKLKKGLKGRCTGGLGGSEAEDDPDGDPPVNGGGNTGV